MQIRDQWRQLGDDGSAPARVIAEDLGCSTGYVQQMRREYNETGAELRCSECTALDDPKVPILATGRCLWCELDVRGIDHRDFYQSEEWRRYVTPEVVAENLPERDESDYAAKGEYDA